MKKITKFISSVVCIIGISLSVHAERIIFAGDSITGLGERNKYGWGHLIREALTKTTKDSDIILLGGSGQSVGSWTRIIKRSKKENFHLDARNFDVKKEFDAGADIVVIMLGMNDVIGPYVDNNKKAIESWAKRYQNLIDALKSRVKAKEIALATISMQTEDLLSFKNKLVDALNARIKKLAKANGCKVLPVSQEYKKVFNIGREVKPDFHITYDYVHPTKYGHMAIAVGMLKGLGKKKAADYLEQKYYSQIAKNVSRGKKGISYSIIPNTNNKPGELQKFKLKVNAFNFKSDNDTEIKISLPKGWTATPEKILGKGSFIVTGKTEKLQNIITITAKKNGKTYKTKAIINAPWLICWGIKQPRWMYRKPLDVKNSITAIDQAIASAKDFLLIPVKKGGEAPEWKLYYPNFNYTGKQNPDSIDFAAVCNENVFNAAYGVRWIFSPKQQKVKLKINTRIFAGNIFMTVWLNRKQCYQDEITNKKKKQDIVEIELTKGWNELILKSNHRAWLWQNSVSLIPVSGNTLDKLLYSVQKEN